ncbi:peptidase S8/S53 domain-containing protein [Mortierella sp. GBAus27b]|nr:hypothetical protein BGX31_004706 [Mortierella sp. GBA43]KAI8345638.1 peptidase S8/S53 domain-containing protein [Mortierella sp. GBAus27b]
MKISSLLSLIAAATLVSAAPLYSLEPRSDAIDSNLDPDVVPGAFIIEYNQDVHRTQGIALLGASIDISLEIRTEFKVFNGVSIQIRSGHTIEDLAKIPGVKRVWPVQRYRVARPTPSSRDNISHTLLTSAHNMTGVDYVHDVFKFTGKGIRVAVIDSGVDYTHPALGGCFGRPECRVSVGYDYIDNDPDPMDDCNGHGTHVAGIIGADARNVGAPQPFVGVAPDVTFGAYRVLGCDGGGSGDGIMKAMERAAVDDKMDILNLSLGGGPAYRSNPLAILADQLVAKGVSVVAAAGNDGADGIWMVSDGSLSASTTSVASFDNIAGSYNYFSYGGVEYPYVYSDGWGKPLSSPASATLVPVLEKDGSLSDGCLQSSYEGHDVAGKVVLVKLFNGNVSRCKSGDRGAIAKAIGAAGMLIQAAPYGLFAVAGLSEFPMATVERYAGFALIDAYKANPANTFEWPATKKEFRIEGGGVPSDFSSWGFDGELHLKPDVSGPGGKILSTFPLKMGSYHVESGTSMATPYVAGAHALLFESRGKIPGVDARRILMNTAIPGRFFEHTETTSVVKQGGGLINVKNAISAKNEFTPDRIELLDSVKFAGKGVKVTIRNLRKTPTTYVLSHETTESVISYRGGNTLPKTEPIFEKDKATVSFSQSSITVQPGQSADILVDFNEPSTGDASEFPFYSGYVVATPRVQGAISLRIPYAGVKGDVSKIPILDIDSGYPKLLVRNRASKETSPVEGSRLINWNAEQIVIDYRLGSHTPELSFRLFNVATGNFVGFLNTDSGKAILPYVGRTRNLNPETGKPILISDTWTDGKVYETRDATTSTALSPGEYKVVVAAQRKFSKGDYPTDFEVHEIGAIRVE